MFNNCQLYFFYCSVHNELIIGGFMESLKSKRADSNLSFSIDLRWICMFLLAVIAGMLLIWKPWQPSTQSDSRTVEVTGEAKIKAEPDEFVFYPYYEFSGNDKEAALKEVANKSSELTAKLKELGVEEKQIKTNSDGYDKYYPLPEAGTPTYSLRLEVRTGSKDTAQKVQDYLVSTAPKGSVSPQTSFSDAKRKQLESEARDQATKEARSKAEQSAKNLGFSIGKVKSVKDGIGFDGAAPMYATDAMTMRAEAAGGSSLQVQPGENELNYSVSVSYYLK